MMKKILSGLGASPGIAIGRVQIISENEFEINKLALNNKENELEKLTFAITKAANDVAELISSSYEKLEEDIRQILVTHQAIIQDRTLKKMIEKKINNGFSAEYSLRSCIDELKTMFEKMDSEYKKQRADDLEDICTRILRIMSGMAEFNFKEINNECILIKKDISPGEMVQMNFKFIKGFITETGGKMSHTAIMARNLGIPAVVGVKNLLVMLNDGDIVIINGLTGEVFINPDEKTINNYANKVALSITEKEHLKIYTKKEAKTADGKKIIINCNVGSIDDIEVAMEYGADGIGLLRSEFMLSNCQKMPSEEEQFLFYKKAIEKCHKKSLIIRTFDIGGDKEFPYLNLKKELNPFLGNRGIRLCLQRIEIFKPQLKAILRATKYGDIKIMLPMISDLAEFRAAKGILEQCKLELKESGTDLQDNVKLGVMIEIPAAAINSDLLAREVDFFSIGTNDLIQYILAVDRINEDVSEYYNPLNTAVLRLIAMVIKNANENNIPVGICGEMASDSKLIPVLIGLGIYELSISPQLVLQVKQIIAKLKFSEIKILAESLLKMDK